MKKIIVTLILLGLLASGCGRKNISTIVDTPLVQFSTQTLHHDMKVYARIASHDEVSRWFNRAEDLYHYYHISVHFLVKSNHLMVNFAILYKS
ncbi:MAG: hypothetical protein WCJ17_03565 [bacterium]